MGIPDKRFSSGEGYISYADALEWQKVFVQSYRCLVDWKFTMRRENDGGVGCYITAFVRERGGTGKLLGHQVVRFGKGQDAVTLPAAIVRALILLDRDLGGLLDNQDEDDGSTDPAQPLLH